MRKLFSIALVAIIASSLVFVTPAFAGRGPGNGGGSGGGGGVCQNLLTTWVVDPDKNTMAPGQTSVFTLNVTNNCANMQEVKLSTTDAGMTFDPASFSLKTGEKIQIKVKVTMPAQNGRNEVWFTIKFTCSVGNGKIVKFRIRYTNKICCNFVASWVSNPNGKKVDSKTQSVFQLDVTNKCTSAINFKMSGSSTNIKFSKVSFTVNGGKTERVNVIISPPARRLTNRIEYSITVTSLCGETKKLTFVLEYK